MKVISVGLISLIIFNIVLAKNSSDSESTTGCSSLLEEKTKKTHKTTEESVNVKDKGPYEEDYEEDYEDMIKDIFMPLKNNHQYSKNNSHKQGDAPPPVSKGPKKQKFTEKRQLRTINENKEICQKTKDLLCTDPEKDTKKNPKKPYSTPEEIYEKNEHLLCTNPNETINAAKLMNEAARYLENHATFKDGYKFREWSPYYSRSFCVKKHGDTVVQRINFQYYHPNNYNEIINLLWDPALANNRYDGSVKRKIVRVYNPNLVMIKQRYKKGSRGRWKYFYALAAKVDISKEKTIIVMASANINDGYPSEKEYKNKIIESANLFKTDIDSNIFIRNGILKKTFVNIAGYLIERKGVCVNITYLESIDGHTSSYNKLFIEATLNKFLPPNEKYVI
ncbi:fam-a protein [Plasmodium vinckei lentum]|uniref:Fam-a protein n=1 Tax=Plasmodium vinckei lentum TaxID=138297 RepID=A0A6V7RZ70_PLAVN|nr:fam-a protein [Plasmodium vinckei lentum]